MQLNRLQNVGFAFRAIRDVADGMVKKLMRLIRGEKTERAGPEVRPVVLP